MFCKFKSPFNSHLERMAKEEAAYRLVHLYTQMRILRFFRELFPTHQLLLSLLRSSTVEAIKLRNWFYSQHRSSCPAPKEELLPGCYVDRLTPLVILACRAVPPDPWLSSCQPIFSCLVDDWQTRWMVMLFALPLCFMLGMSVSASCGPCTAPHPMRGQLGSRNRQFTAV